MAGVEADNGKVVLTSVCFAAGTLIRMEHGDRAVETLAVGDLVITSSGAKRPIRWLGHRIVKCGSHPNAQDVRPIRIAEHALGPNRPSRALCVSPGHAICIDVVGEVLIPAGALVNGATIQQIEVDEIAYWHVELDSHDILLAENLPAESYLDMGNRGFFAESEIVDLAANPDADPTRRDHADFCRPFHCGDVLVEVVRAQLFERARSLGWTLRHDPLADLHLVVDGYWIDPAARGDRVRFHVPAGAQEVWLVSKASRPADVGRGSDTRALGVCVLKLSIEDGFAPAHGISLEDPLLEDCFHPFERDGEKIWRWTKGPTQLPAALWADYPEGFFLRLDHDGEAMPRWITPYGEEAASKSRDLGGQAGRSRSAVLAQTPSNRGSRSPLTGACGHQTARQND